MRGPASSNAMELAREANGGRFLSRGARTVALHSVHCARPSGAPQRGRIGQPSVPTLLAGTPALTLLGMIGAALAVTLRRGGLLLPILVLPLSIPTLIFGVIAANQAADGGSAFGAPFSILCALSLFGLVVGPFAAAASLRQGLD